MSVQRTFAQRNGNVTQVIPQYQGIAPNTDISGAAIYSVTIPTLEYTKGSYFVDLSGADLSGNLLNFNGEFYPFFPGGSSQSPITTILFSVNIPTSASVYPGLEFTLTFRNLPYDRFSHPPLLTIGLIGQGAPFPYITSPPFPPLATSGTQSVTFKSDGNTFNVVSSGPAGWMGVPALSVILSAYNGLMSP